MIQEKEILSLLLIREIFSTRTTLGSLFVNGKYFSYTLEDALRYRGLKIQNQTCIQDGMYKIIVNESQTFRRKLPLLLDVPFFEGIRIHGGNTVEDSSGCILIGYNWIKPDSTTSDNRIQGSAEQDLIKLIESQNMATYITIINKL